MILNQSGGPAKRDPSWKHTRLSKELCVLWNWRAANWTRVGQIKGRSRNDRYATLKVPIKDIYLYPLIKRFREALSHEA